MCEQLPTHRAEYSVHAPCACMRMSVLQYRHETAHFPRGLAIMRETEIYTSDTRVRDTLGSSLTGVGTDLGQLVLHMTMHNSGFRVNGGMK